MADGSISGPEVQGINNEVRLPQQTLTWDYGEGSSSVRLSVAKFVELKTEAGVTPEQAEQRKRLFVFLPGSPLDATSKPSLHFPGELSQAFRSDVLSVSAYSQKEDPQGMALQADAIYQFLLEQVKEQNLQGEEDLTKALKDTELIIMGHSGGTRRAAYLTKALEDRGIEPAALVLASPMGLSQRGKLGLIKDFIIDTLRTGPKQRKMTGVRAGDKNPVVEKVPLEEAKKAFKQDVKKTFRLIGTKGLWSQLKGFADKDPIYSQIKAPITVIANDQDMISNHRDFIPETQVRGNMAPLTKDDVWRELSGKKWEEYRGRVVGSKDWEEISDEEKQSRLDQFNQQFGSKEAFTAKDSIMRARQEERVRLAKARKIIAQQQYFPTSKQVDVVVPTRQADHTGVIASRARQVRPLVDRVKNFMKRVA